MAQPQPQPGPLSGPRDADGGPAVVVTPSPSPPAHHVEQPPSNPYHHHHGSSLSDRDARVRIEHPPEHSRSRSPRPHEHIKASHKRMMTNLDQAPIDSRMPVKYVIRRPMARFIEHEGKTYHTNQDGSIELANIGPAHASGPHNRDGHHHVDPIHISRERLDLFVDLLWVGIISNLAEIYYESAFKDNADVSIAFSEFLLLFLPTWTYWARMQTWLNLYYVDDYLQRIIIVWLLVLAMIWGNNAPSFLTGEASDYWLVSSYIVGIGTLKAVEAVYTIWIPWMRRQFLVETLLFVPVTVLWIFAAVYSDLHLRYSFITAAVTYEWAYGAFLRSPLGDALLGPHNFRKAQDNQHLITRYGNFFILTLGEGVFLLIRGSPLLVNEGKEYHGFTSTLGIGIQALAIYYIISITYFRADNCRRYIHSLSRSWYVANPWHFIHVPLFCSLVLLSSGTLYLCKYEAAGNPQELTSEPTTGEPDPGSATSQPAERKVRRAAATPEPSLDHTTFRVAVSTVFVSLAVIYACMAALSLLNRCKDERKDLIISNRYIRIAPRIASVAIFATIWLYDFHHAGTVLAWALLITWVVFMWESFAGMERDSHFFEPRMPYALTPSVSGFSSGEEEAKLRSNDRDS